MEVVFESFKGACLPVTLWPHSEIHDTLLSTLRLGSDDFGEHPSNPDHIIFRLLTSEHP